MAVVDLKGADAVADEIGRPGRIEAVTEEEWDRTLAVDLKAHFLTCRAVVPIMRRQGGGHIVNVSSIAGGT